jgi:hypothetical protein
MGDEFGDVPSRNACWPKRKADASITPGSLYRRRNSGVHKRIGQT